MRFTREDDFVLPIRTVRCPFCSDWVTVDIGIVEDLWMHEYDCSAILKDYELAPGWEAPERAPEVERERVPLAA